MHAGTIKDAGSSLAARLQSFEQSFGATGYTFAIQVGGLIPKAVNAGARISLPLMPEIQAPISWLLLTTCERVCAGWLPPSRSS